MSPDPPQLIDALEFDAPPIAEVVLGVGFEGLDHLTPLEAVALYQSQYQHRDFERIEEVPPYQFPIERFGPQLRMPEIRFQQGRPPIRYWFVDKSGNELVQVQHNWFARNWRRQAAIDSSPSSYPRFPSIHQPFESDLQAFVSFIEDQRPGSSLFPTQCEVTYINHIQKEHADLARILTVWCDPAGARRLPSMEQANFAMSYVMRRPNSDDPVGRLHISLQSGLTVPEQAPLLVLNLTARGRPFNDSMEGVSEFLDLGHKWILTAFDAVTTEQMHIEWGKQL